MMSKLKVSFSNVFKACFIIQQTKTRKYVRVYTLTFLKTLRHYNPFIEKPNEDKICHYWIHQTIPEIISLADRLYEEEKYIDVYELLNRIRFIKEPKVLWRIARALYMLTFDNAVNDGFKWEMIEEAYDVLDIALTIGEDSAYVHKWMAIIMDMKNGMINLEYRTKNSAAVRDHLMRACELNPEDFACHYMMGRWCFDMCQLSWLQRCIAKYFIAAGPPRSTYHEAYMYLSRAEELQPRSFLPNVYLLGRTCLEIGHYYKAKYYLNLATNLPPRDHSEKCYIVKAKRLLTKLERYDLGKDVLFYGDDPLGFNE